MNIALPMSFDGTKTTVNTKYIEYIVNSGNTPVLISPEMDIEQVMQKCDTLILPGGIDVEPTYYGFDNMSSYSVNPEKDQFERTLLHLSVKNKYPIFGICRGFQLIVYEHIASIKRETYIKFRQHLDLHAQSDKDVPRPCRSHQITISKDLYKFERKDSSDLSYQMFVNSMHHQAVAVSNTVIKQGPILPCGIHVLAYTDFGFSTKKEVIIEAFTIPKYRIVAVQWHPEELMDIELLKSSITRWD